ASAPLPAVHVTWPPGGAGEPPAISFDGIGVSPALLAKPTQVDPGTHVIVARDARGRTSRHVVEARDREIREITVAFGEDRPEGARTGTVAVAPAPGPSPRVDDARVGAS